MRVDIERVRELLAEIAAINRVDLEAIEVYEHGEPVAISKEAIEDWRFVGLSNMTFLEIEAWKD